MRFDLVFASAHLFGSGWGALAGPEVCPARLTGSPTILQEARWVSASKAPTSTITAFVDVSVIPMDTERVLSNQTVLVEGGRITALGPTSQVKVPAGAVRIDGQGKYLLPGLGDMHSPHSTKRSIFQNDITRNFLSYKLMSGVTTVRSPEGGEVDPEQVRGDSLAAKTPIPRLYLAPMNQNWAQQLDSLTSYFAAAKAAGYHHIGIGYELTGLHTSHEKRTVFDSIVAAARRVGLPVASHADPMLPFDAMPALGAAGGSTEHLKMYYDSLGFTGRHDNGTWDPSRDPEPVAVPRATIERLVAATQRAGLWITPTLQCVEHKYSPTPAHLQIMRQLVKSLADAGVRLLLGGDDGWTVHEELAALVRAGLTPYQALVTGTRNVAAFYKMDSTGIVAVGTRADLVLLYGNPLVDIRHTREPAGVMLDGRWLDRVALDQHLLASPRAWFEAARMNHLNLYHRSMPEEQRANVRKYWGKLVALTDSLTGTEPKSSAYEHVLRRFTNELGALRALLTPEMYKTFDPFARVWLREHVRQGYRLTIPGVALGP